MIGENGADVIWEAPFSHGSFIDSPYLETEIGGNISLALKYDDEEKGVQFAIEFDGVVAYQVVYSVACTVDMIKTAYNKLVLIKDNNWRDILLSGGGSEEDLTNLRHYRIYFDEYSCYDFLCAFVNVRTVSNDLSSR